MSKSKYTPVRKLLASTVVTLSLPYFFGPFNFHSFVNLLSEESLDPVPNQEDFLHWYPFLYIVIHFNDICPNSFMLQTAIFV